MSNVLHVIPVNRPASKRAVYVEEQNPLAGRAYTFWDYMSCKMPSRPNVCSFLF